VDRCGRRRPAWDGLEMNDRGACLRTGITPTRACGPLCRSPRRPVARPTSKRCSPGETVCTSGRVLGEGAREQGSPRSLSRLTRTTVGPTSAADVPPILREVSSPPVGARRWMSLSGQSCHARRGMAGAARKQWRGRHGRRRRLHGGGRREPCEVGRRRERGRPGIVLLRCGALDRSETVARATSPALSGRAVSLAGRPQEEPGRLESAFVMSDCRGAIARPSGELAHVPPIFRA
jgi:hypothetical protein